MIDELFARTVAAGLNRMLSRQDWARERLRPFAGRVARFEAPPVSLMLSVGADGCFEPGREPAAVTIRIDAASLPQALFDPKVVMKNVRLEGDAEFAQALSQVLPALRPEIEEDLAPWVGDAAAVRIVSTARQFADHAREAGDRFARASADYFVAEQPMIVGRAEFDGFAADVVRLRDAVERIDKRTQRLAAAG